MHLFSTAGPLVALGVAVAGLMAMPLMARADDADPTLRRASLPDRRYELAGFPIIGGNSDIGLQFGGAATLTRFYDRAAPYLWNVDLLLSGSLKDDVDGVRLVEQSHVLRLDSPGLLDGKLRLDTRASFQKQINAGYYGIGNEAPAPSTSDPRRYEYGQTEARLRTIVRVHTGERGIDLALGGVLRWEGPEVYAGSLLARDVTLQPGAAAPLTLGSQAALLGGLAAGVMIDTRDSEFVTRSGIFYQLGAGFTVGTEERTAYGNVSAVLAHYAPLGEKFLLASRFIASFQFGRVPFYDLAQGGTFESQYLLGGESGVRGVPQGRYAGEIKFITNLELRGTPFPRFTIGGSSFRIGTTTFLDAGRVFGEYRAVSPADGDHLGLKYGVGGGLFLQWGEAAIFRVEVAYSPDAVSENASLPLGIYVSDGLMF